MATKKTKKVVKKKKNNKVVKLKKCLKKKINLYKKQLKKKFTTLKKKTSKKTKTKETTKKLDIKSLTSKQVEEELKREIYKSKYIKVLKSTIYALIIIAAVATLIATLIMPVLQINGTSMSPTYNGNEIVVSIKTKNLKQGDIIAFYHGNKILVKRVIAGAGSWITIDKKGNVYVNGEVLDEPYLVEKSLGESNIEYPYQVPDGSWFVLGDNRSDSLDSRNTEVGCIKEDDVIGKILFKVWPLGNSE